MTQGVLEAGLTWRGGCEVGEAKQKKYPCAVTYSEKMVCQRQRAGLEFRQENSAKMLVGMRKRKVSNIAWR